VKGSHICYRGKYYQTLSAFLGYDGKKLFYSSAVEKTLVDHAFASEEKVTMMGISKSNYRKVLGKEASLGRVDLASHSRFSLWADLSSQQISCVPDTQALFFLHSRMVWIMQAFRSRQTLPSESCA
jgi:hypothetical protein